MQLIIATTNSGKIREITTIIASFTQLDLEILTLKGRNITEPDEPHNSYMENAKHKAKYYAEQTGIATLSEDSGLSIDALNGFPGVRTKEFVAECGSLEQAYAKLEAMLKNSNNYNASFICAATIYLPQQNQFICFEGKCSGKITFPPRGIECFGFDPIYIPNGYNNTMAELGEDLKNEIGHRGNAIRGLMQALSLRTE